MNISNNPVKGFLLDITGVLYNSDPNTIGRVIQGSVEAVNRLYAESTVRFVTNESTRSRKHLFEKLTKLGFTVNEEHIFMPVPEAKRYIKDHNLRPHILVHKRVREEFEDLDTNHPNCVLLGDAEGGFTYETMNAAFRVLQKTSDPLIITLGCGKFYQRLDGPCMDVGGFTRALQYACDARVITIGKPEEQFFRNAVDDMGLMTNQVVMIGDDIVSDVGGAQKAGIRGVQVRTGKWRQCWINHTIKPDLLADDLQSAVDMLLKKKTN
ncbi:HAD-superfamily subfamily IIA hydrolase [Loa loa]|uniref:Phospholysine phosphohistidine inorganic pyrophosphate phosphatase n=1 Tax=Loa loa TaxID=7209 RepID=A0A1I7VQI0_LOALO|nr:HAD-superfamily subfamily IIA hydrolase [Loa loa]EFO14632.1 HAD-superfamily subfamily IIA hydrolase [Loa loa]